MRSGTFFWSRVCLLYRPRWLRGGTDLRSRAFLDRRPGWRNRPLLGSWSHLLSRHRLLDRPFLLGPLDGGPGLWALLHHWGRPRLTPFHGKRFGHHHRLRLAAVYGNELGAVCAGGNPVLLLNG